MNIKDLPAINNADPKSRLSKTYTSLEKIVKALQQKEIPELLVGEVNEQIDTIDPTNSSDKSLTKALMKTRTVILQKIKKELNLTIPGHFRMQWMVLGMTVFGLPLGMVFGFATKNMGLLGVGLPIGMIIGMFVGSRMDAKAKAEGRQLEIN